MAFVPMTSRDGRPARWWYIDWEWKLAQALCNWSAFVVAGRVLAGFVRLERAGAGV